jgi:hypothetical protein
MRCRNCGADVDPREEYCPECGARLRPRRGPNRTLEVEKISREELEAMAKEREYRHRKAQLRRIAKLIGVLLAFMIYFGGIYIGYRKVFGDKSMNEVFAKFGILQSSGETEKDDSATAGGDLTDAAAESAEIIGGGTAEEQSAESDGGQSAETQ